MKKRNLLLALVAAIGLSGCGLYDRNNQRGRVEQHGPEIHGQRGATHYRGKK